MAHSFKNYPASPCFAKFKESMYSSEYITKKKIRSSFCNFNCYPNKNLYSQSNLIMFKQPCYQIDKTQLYINLITKLQLNNDIPVIIDTATGISPTIIDPNQNPITKYTIDVSGNLFGNDMCTINNWQNYIVYNN